jgi:acyl-CoA thioesterase
VRTGRNLFYMNSPVTSNGRGLVHGRIYKRDGTLAGALHVHELLLIGNESS